MNYVDLKQFELEKGAGSGFAQNFYENTIVRGFPGLVSFDVGLNESNPEYDLVVITITWKDKDAYMEFKKSDIHAQSHKGRKPNPLMKRHRSINFETVHTLKG